MISTPEQPRNDDWRAPLRARFPMARSIGIGCFKGWQPILTRMFERLEATVAQQPASARRGFKIREIRQKFGTLTVYLTKATPEVQAVVDEAQEAALVTCEVCGSPGRLAERRGWISVKCDAQLQRSARIEARRSRIHVGRGGGLARVFVDGGPLRPQEIERFRHRPTRLSRTCRKSNRPIVSGTRGTAQAAGQVIIPLTMPSARPKKPPLVVVVAGPNGAGKSTTAPRLLRGALAVREFVNADQIAQGLSAFRPETVALAAGRVMLARLNTLAAGGDSFAFETTLASRNFAPWLRTLRRQGFHVHLIFLSLPTADLAVARVAERVRQGGHDVPEEVIRRRFVAGLSNFFTLFEPVADSWQMFDNAQIGGPRLIAERRPGAATVVKDEAAWKRLREMAE